MNIDQLRDAADSYERGYAHFPLYVAIANRQADCNTLSNFGYSFLNSDPITSEWLVEKWGWATSGSDSAWSKDDSCIIRMQTGYLIICGRPLPLPTQGQFTALMFGIGQYPKDK